MAKRKAAKKTRAPKATKAAVKTRVEEVIELLLEGRTRSFIIRYGAENWQLAARQVDQYIHEATEEIGEVTKNTAEKTISLLTSSLWSLYRNNKVWHPATARAALMDIAKLHGLDRIDINLHVDRPLKDVSDNELSAIISGSAGGNGGSYGG